MTDTLTQTDRSARPRALLLSGPSFALGLTFIALLIADEANALGG